MKRSVFDPDVTRHDDGPYWAAALVLALGKGDKNRQHEARQNLKRLGYRIDIASDDRKGVANVH